MDLKLSNITDVKSDNNTIEKMLILGTGPAGLSAALYAARADLKPLILSGIEHGGQVSLTYIVENYPGFPEGVGGQEMVELFQRQAERFGAQIVYDTATAVDLSRLPFRITTYNREYLAESLIIATGATPVHLNIPGEVEFTGRGVSYCATCDGWFFKGKDVIVVGGGDSALEEGIFLTRYANSVTIVHRRDTLRAGAILQKRAMSEPKIRFIWNTIVSEINGDNGVKSVHMKNVDTDHESDHPIDGVFVFIGHHPNSQILEGQVALDDHGYVVTDTSMKTSVPGVFVAGEVGDPLYRQVVTSAGMGAAAAMQAIRFLENTSEAEELIVG
jgi:thioredoxin reductase (NADPH)